MQKLQIYSKLHPKELSKFLFLFVKVPKKILKKRLVMCFLCFFIGTLLGH
jgi:hypothetical protein